MTNLVCPACKHEFEHETETPEYNLAEKLGFTPQPLLRLSEISDVLVDLKIMSKPPSRNALIEMCKDGTFEAKETRFGWLVFQDSFESWVNSLQQRIAA